MEQEEKVTAHQKIRKFITKYAKPAGIFFMGVLVLFVIVQIFNYANARKIEKATMAIEDIQNRYAEASEADTSENPSIDAYKSYITELDGVIAKYPKEYAGRRALIIKGDIYFRFKDYDNAAEAYKKFAADYPKSYDAPIAIFNTGVCYESTGKTKEAEAEYLKIYNNYKGSYALMPKLIFSLGRLAEADKRYAEAEKYYNQISEEYSGSNYSLYAQDRIILMHAQGQL
ncbi:MAG: tetratricopeptide repeat protein [Spirochaetia bacterium]|nr:tetratricopeptide repeat protein [Spirochaetia bacterium]